MRNRIRAALQFIHVGGNYERWRVATMIYSELGESGRDLWDEWRGERGNDDASSTWRSASKKGDLKIGSLFDGAKKNGWMDDSGYQAPTPEEKAERKRKAEEARAREEVKIQQEMKKASEDAYSILIQAEPISSINPYLARKEVKPVSTLKEIYADKVAKILKYQPEMKGEPLTRKLLVVPIKKIDGSLSSVELIDGKGLKAALKGRGTKSCGFWATGKLPENDGENLALLIGEGVATVLSAAQATQHPAVAALSCANLGKVARKLRDKYPRATLVILADLEKKSGKPDAHAIEAAKQTGARLAIPDFGEDRKPDQKDFNDLFVSRGVEAVKRDIANAVIPKSAKVYGNEVSLIRASEITPEPIDWLWNGYFASGKLHILGGAPGTGKTTISMSLASTVTNGGRWPDGTPCANPGNVVIWSGEDDPADTLIPRLALSGADLSRVFIVADIGEGNGRRTFDPARDMEPLRRKLMDVDDVRLLIVDSIVSAITGDSHKNAEVRRGLQPLVDLATSKRCALLGLTHFSKGTGGRDPVERITGSLAFGAVARVVLVTAKQQNVREDGRNVRLFCRAKSNIGSDDGGFEYELIQAEMTERPGVFGTSVQWGKPLKGEARELLAMAEATDNGSKKGALVEAEKFLFEVLADGPMAVNELENIAESAGCSWATIRRAQKKIGIKAVKQGMHGGWVWQLPEATKMLNNPGVAQQEEVSTFKTNEHLQGDFGKVEVMGRDLCLAVHDNL